MLGAFGQSIQHMSQHHATMLQDVALKCCKRLARSLCLYLCNSRLTQLMLMLMSQCKPGFFSKSSTDSKKCLFFEGQRSDSVFIIYLFLLLPFSLSL